MPVQRGATRIVLLIGPYALKLPNPRTWRSFLNGMLANMEEAVFACLRDPYLCPVLAALPGGLLVVMQRTQPLTATEFAMLDVSAYQRTTAAIEAKQDSFGWLDGQIVAVDYG